MLQPFQARVVDEKKELDIKRDKLIEFLKGDLAKKLPAAEQERLSRQLSIMESYSGILSERIVTFDDSNN